MLLAASLLLKGLAIPLLARIAWLDFTTQKISNQNVLLLLCLGLGSLQLLSVQSGSWWDMGLSALAGLLLFVALFPFWALRKIGAGDVKLMAVVPLLIGGSGLVVFSVLLLVFALATALIVKNPLMLPARRLSPVCSAPGPQRRCAVWRADLARSDLHDSVSGLRHLDVPCRSGDLTRPELPQQLDEQLGSTPSTVHTFSPLGRDRCLADVGRRDVIGDDLRNVVFAPDRSRLRQGGAAVGQAVVAAIDDFVTARISLRSAALLQQFLFQNAMAALMPITGSSSASGSLTRSTPIRRPTGGNCPCR